MSKEIPTGYELSRQWFDFSFENPDKVRPVHTALYFYAIERCNRLGWKPKFGLPRHVTMDAIGVKNDRTFTNAFNNLVEWGFFILHEKSVNQHSANIIALVKNTVATTSAHTKATQGHIQKQRMGNYVSTVAIDKQEYNKETKKLGNAETEKQEPPRTVSEYESHHDKMSNFARQYGAMDGLNPREIEHYIVKRGSDDWEKPHGSQLKRITQTNIRNDMLYMKQQGWLKESKQDDDATYNGGVMN